MPILQAGLDPAPASGFVACADGRIVREQAVACTSPVEPGNCDLDGAGSCSVDAELAPTGHASPWPRDRGRFAAAWSRAEDPTTTAVRARAAVARGPDPQEVGIAIERSNNPTIATTAAATDLTTTSA
ncbi:MAG: hypothetical protein U0168_03280 [Nannocystaceae bacterium]